MKVSGFTFVKNALIYGYPVVESILSILPICDEVVVAVGKSEDDTLGLIEKIGSSKIRIIKTVWDENVREGGRVLAIETDKAFREIANDSDWAFYIQADEVLHEKYLQPIRSRMEELKEDTSVDGLLFKYLHFYGSYDYVGSSLRWYQNEIRVIRNDSSIYSYSDAQGFRKDQNKKLLVKPVDACIYHYGWVKDPRTMQAKQKNVNKYWHDDQWIDEHIVKVDEYDYASNITSLARFDGTHPNVMRERVRNSNWKFEYDISKNRFTFKEKSKMFFEKYFGLDFNYKNYRLTV